MALDKYKKKRDFKQTNEPEGDKKKSSGKPIRQAQDRPMFVIQKHDASRLHYDFRLEVDGVLKSWAVPKGPSTNPSQKRLAVETEDHPLEYGGFEGVIPEGQYGAGTVMVWDMGTFENLKDDSLEKQYKNGQIEVWLKGEKLEGGYALINSKMGGKKKNWLLIKMKDEKADARRNPVSTEPNSAKTGRSLEEIREQKSEKKS